MPEPPRTSSDGFLQKPTLRRIWVQAICTRSTFRGVRGEIGTGRDATQMSKWGGHGCGKPRKASSGTPGHVEYTSGLSYLRDNEAGWLSTIPIHHWLRDAPRGVRTLSFQSPPRAGSCSIADRSISVEYWEMRGDGQGTLHTQSCAHDCTRLGRKRQEDLQGECQSLTYY